MFYKRPDKARQIPDFCSALKRKFVNRRDQRAFCSTSPAAVRPNPLTTAPVQFRKKCVRHERHFHRRMIGGLSACGSATVVQLRLRSRRLSAYASLSRSPNRRPKPQAKTFPIVVVNLAHSFWSWVLFPLPQFPESRADLRQ